MLPRADSRFTRPTTRLPFPIADDARHYLVGAAYHLGGRAGRPLFRRRVTVEHLAHARILIFKPCCLGDVIFATPLVRELRRAAPGATITFGVGRHSRPAIESNPHIDDVLDSGPVGSGPYRWSELLSLAANVRGRRFDACFVLERSAILSLLPLIAGIPARIGIDSGGRGWSLNVGVSPRPSRPESELYLDLLRAIGGRPTSGALEYRPTDSAARNADQLLLTRIPRGRPIVLLHCAGGTNPGMALARKRWPAERFAELARRIADAGGVAVLVGGPEDRAVAEGLLSRLTDSGAGSAVGDGGRFVDLVGELDLGDLAALAVRATAYVGNDSGPSHLAEAAGARVVMLFGPSDPIVYGPRGRNAVPISAGFWCSPCFVDGRVAPCANVLCMPSISVDRVWAEIAPLLSEGTPR